MKIKFITLIILLISPSSIFAQKSVRYDLYISDTTVNFSGKSSDAIAVNGHIPGPTLEFTEGDTAVIYFHNTMDIETSIHSHGVILPNIADGVPYLTTAPIMPHTTHLYTFPVVQNGTFFWHAHTELQEQSGLYGAYVFHKRKNDKSRREQDNLPEYTMVLSDWTNENPSEVLRSLHMANDWYSIKKHTTQNWGEAIIKGYFTEKVKQEWLRMFPMDVSDVYYDAFLTNGQTRQNLPQLGAGSKLRLRIINASSSSYYWLQYAGSKLSVIASDGEDVEPVEVDRMIIGVSETYDVVVTVPENMSYEFKATAEDRTGSTSLWLGNGMQMAAPILPKLNYFAGMKMMNNMMHLDGSMDAMGMQMSSQMMDMNNVMYPEITGEDSTKPFPNDSAMNMNPMPGMDMSKMNRVTKMSKMAGMNMNSSSDIVTLNYGMLRSTEKTSLPAGPTTILTFNLTGNMNRYQWSINNVALSDADQILIPRGRNVRVILNNQTMMRHPMHLHGHYFRLLNGMDDYSPLKNVLDIMPMEIDTIEFAAQYDGDWFFHCHILYHMMSGMGRVFRMNQNGTIEPIPNSDIDPIKNSWNKFADDNMWHFGASIAAQSQSIFAKAMLMDRNYLFDGMASVNYKGSFESETHFARFIDRQQFLKLYIGSDIRMLNETIHSQSNSSVENRKVATFGIQYLLPMFLQTDLRVDHTGKFRFQIARNDLALTSRLRFDAMWNTDKEYEIGLHYILFKRFSLSANYDSHFGLGAGIMFTY